MSGIQSTVLSSVMAGVGSVIRIPLTIAAVGVPAYGALSTICALFGWVWFIPAGARNAGAAAAVGADHDDADATEVARSVARETLRHAALVVGLLAVLVLVARFKVKWRWRTTAAILLIACIPGGGYVVDRYAFKYEPKPKRPPSDPGPGSGPEAGSVPEPATELGVEREASGPRTAEQG